MILVSKNITHFLKTATFYYSKPALYIPRPQRRFLNFFAKLKFFCQSLQKRFVILANYSKKP
ncbi:MAG: hypothetical protein DBY32_04380 [Phascolarctobacterium sp.]|nr:MAG: hypothetical protein DBY32_04380 [Phascolarctobacterium sp.]